MNRSKGRRPGLVGAALALLVASTVLAGCGLGEDALHPVPASRPDLGPGAAITVQVPAGAIDVTFGEGVDEIDGSYALDGVDHLAPDWHEFVPVTIRSDLRANDGIANVSDGALELTDLVLELGDRSVPLGHSYTVEAGRLADQTATTTYVPMGANERAGLTVVATYDGLVQRIDLEGNRTAGAAEPLYDGRAGRGETVICSDGWQTKPGTSLESACEVTPAFTPYLPGVGWAEPGRIFVALDVAIRPHDSRIGKRVPYPQRLRLDGSVSNGVRVETGTPIGISTGPAETSNFRVPLHFDAVEADQYDLRLDAKVQGVDAWVLVSLERD